MVSATRGFGCIPQEEHGMSVYREYDPRFDRAYEEAYGSVFPGNCRPIRSFASEPGYLTSTERHATSGVSIKPDIPHWPAFVDRVTGLPVYTLVPPTPEQLYTPLPDHPETWALPGQAQRDAVYAACDARNTELRKKTIGETNHEKYLEAKADAEHHREASDRLYAVIEQKDAAYNRVRAENIVHRKDLRGRNKKITELILRVDELERTVKLKDEKIGKVSDYGLREANDALEERVRELTQALVAERAVIDRLERNARGAELFAQVHG